MDKDIVAVMKALTMEASDTDPVPEAATPAEEAPLDKTPPLEDSLSTVCHRGNMGQENMGQEKNDEMGKMSIIIPHPSAKAGGPGPDVAPEVSSGANGGGEAPKKHSRKRRNRKKSKKVYLPWPLTMQAGVPSTTTFLCQASVVGAVSIANVGLASKKQRKKGKKGQTSVIAQFWQAPDGTGQTEGSPSEPSEEGASVADSKEIKRQRKRNCKKRAKKNKNLVVSPWPLTIQAWASFMSPALVQTESLLAANDKVKQVAKSRHLGGKEDSATEILAQALGSPASPMQASLEEVFLTANTERKIEKKSRQKRGESKKVYAPWPLTVQAWASFTAETDPDQTFSQELFLDEEDWPPLEKSTEKIKCFVPWSEGKDRVCSFSEIAPLQTSLMGTAVLEMEQPKQNNSKRNPDTGEEECLQGGKALLLESYQAWGNAERYPEDEDQDYWDYTVLDLTKEDDDFDFGDLFSNEGRETSTLTENQTYTSSAEPGRQEAEEDRVNSERVWMGVWNDF